MPVLPARLPPWLKTRLPSGANFERIKGLASSRRLNTVCEQARCPNLGECWGGGTATFMLLGSECTRGCRFCSVKTALKPPPPDPEEPVKLCRTIMDMGLDYTVLTTVCRDDLADQGAAHVAACIRELRRRLPELIIEALVQDFRGDIALLRVVADARPHVLAHNIETVRRLTPLVRDRKAGYEQSLKVLFSIKEARPAAKSKSSLMLGLGETEAEIIETLKDLRENGVDIVTLGQYLRPSQDPHHLPVTSFIPPVDFARYEALAREIGFEYAAAGPFVRSSYRAGELFIKKTLPSIAVGGNHDRA